MEQYVKQNFKNGDIIEANSLNKIEDGIVDLQNFTLTKIDDMESGVYNTAQRAISDLIDENIENHIDEGLNQKIEEIQLKALTGKKGDAEGSEIFNDYANNTATGNYSHAEGKKTSAPGLYSHAEGYGTVASGFYSHAEGEYAVAYGSYGTHAEGKYTIASGNHQHVQGKWNIEDTEHKYAHIVGNGNNNNRSNAHTLDWDGNAWFAGKVFVGGNSQDDAIELGAGFDEMVKEDVFINGIVITNFSEMSNETMKGYASKTLYQNWKNGEEYTLIVSNGHSTQEIKMECGFFGTEVYLKEKGASALDDSKWIIYINEVTIAKSFYDAKSGDIRIIVKQPTDEKYLCKQDGTPLTKPYVVDSENYTYGDGALQAILDGRHIYVKVPNISGEWTPLYENLMPVLQYQLPTNNNSYLTLFYLKDGLAQNLAITLGTAIQGGTPDFSILYGEITMALKKSYERSPLPPDELDITY